MAYFSGRKDHIALEIVKERTNNISFFITVPAYIRRFLEQQVHAQYPDAQIEPVEDYNIFTPQGVVQGAYLQLKKQYINGGKNMAENLPDTPLEITDADIDENIKKYQTIVIDCWAPWCGPCKMVHPIIEELAKEMQGKIVFGKLNVDENPMTSAKHQIMSIPTLLVFKNGNLVDRIVGAMPKETLKERIEKF